MRVHRDVRTCGTLGRLQTLHVIRRHPLYGVVWWRVTVCVSCGEGEVEERAVQRRQEMNL